MDKLKIFLSRALVNREFYARKYPDVANSGMDFVEHFARYGLESPIRAPNHFIEKVLFSTISFVMLALTFRKRQRRDLEDIFIHQSTAAYQRSGFFPAVYYYNVTMYLIANLSSQILESIEHDDDTHCNKNELSASVWRLKNSIADIPTSSELSSDKSTVVTLYYFLIMAARNAYSSDNTLRYSIFQFLIRLCDNFCIFYKRRTFGIAIHRGNHVPLTSLNKCNTEAIWTFHFSEKTPSGSARILGEAREDNKIFLKSRPIIIPFLRNVVIFSKSNIVILENGDIINDTGTGLDYERYVLHSSDPVVIGRSGSAFLINTGGRPNFAIDSGIMLSGVASNAYGHWIADYIVRLEFCERCGVFSKLPIIVDEDMPKSHFDLLRLVCDNQLIKIPQGSSCTVGRLLYAPPLTFFPTHLFPNDIPVNEINTINPQSFRYVKKKIEEKIPPSANLYRKIYLSRRSSSWRRLVNDAEVADYLSTLGYETIAIESYDFPDQVKIFQESSHIVAANGSSTYNFIFCNSAVKLLMLAQKDLNNLGGFNMLMDALGYDLHFICGDAVDPNGGKHSDYKIPLDLLKRAMQDFD